MDDEGGRGRDQPTRPGGIADAEMNDGDDDSSVEGTGESLDSSAADNMSADEALNNNDLPTYLTEDEASMLQRISPLYWAAKI
jgi:hypothetical protein